MHFQHSIYISKRPNQNDNLIARMSTARCHITECNRSHHFALIFFLSNRTIDMEINFFIDCFGIKIQWTSFSTNIRKVKTKREEKKENQISGNHVFKVEVDRKYVYIFGIPNRWIQCDKRFFFLSCFFSSFHWFFYLNLFRIHNAYHTGSTHCV